MSTQNIPMPVSGVDVLSTQAFVKAGAVREATNVDLRNDGVFMRRAGFTTADARPGYTSLYANARGTLVTMNGGLYVINSDGSQRLIFNLNSNDMVDFTEYNGHVYFTNSTTIGWIPGDDATVRNIGVAPPASLPEVVSQNAGTLLAGKYALALSWVDDRGEESPVRTLGVHGLTSGVKLTGLEVRAGYRYRFYISPKDGDQLYLADEWEALLSEHTCDVNPAGTPVPNMFLATMPPGTFIRGGNGRLFVASGNTLWYSEPLRPHVYDPRYNFLKFDGEIRFIEVLNNGVYVGDSTGVYWLDGSDPTKYIQRQASTIVPIKRSSIIVSPSVLPEKFRSTNAPVAVWLSTAGYFVGVDQGVATPLQPERVRLAADLEGKSVLLIRDGIKQIITLTAAVNQATPIMGVAIDSPYQ